MLPQFRNPAARAEPRTVTFCQFRGSLSKNSSLVVWQKREKRDTIRRGTSLGMVNMIKLVFFLTMVGAAAAFSPLQRHFSSVTRNAVSSLSRLHMATWSDNRAVQEYKDFLSSGKQEIEKTPDMPSVIIRPGEGFDATLAEGVFNMGMQDDIIIVPHADLPPSIGNSERYPIYVALPPTLLREFIQNLPDSYKQRAEDFVFFSGGLQCGNIESVLKDYGYCRDAMTQVLISGVKFKPNGVVEDSSVALGADAQGEQKWAGQCSACGKWSGSIQQRLERNAVRCKSVFYRDWRRDMWERNIYDSVFHLVGAVRAEPTNLQDVALYYENEVSDMAWSISGMLKGSRAITLPYGFEERMFGVGEMAAGEPCVLIDEMFPFLYEPFMEIPKFLEYMCYAQDEMGKLPATTFLRRAPNKMDKPPIIRQIGRAHV